MDIDLKFYSALSPLQVKVTDVENFKFNVKV